MPSNPLIVEWFVSLGISDVLTTEDILSGNSVHAVLKKSVAIYKNDFVSPSSAVNKISNWNNLIKSLQKINIKVSAEDKNQILRGNQQIIYEILSQIKNYVDENTKQPEVDINKIDHRSDPKNSKSLLELFILVIIKNLGLNAKESVALLSNDSKYLAHILAKGFKDQPGPAINLLKDFQSLLPKIHEFCLNKENELFFLKSIKPGLISKFKEISILSLQIIQQFSLKTTNAFEILKNHLIPTLVLQYRRHNILLERISHTIIKLSKYTKPLLTLFPNNMNQKQVLLFCYEILCISQQSNHMKSFYSLLRIEDIVVWSIESLNDNQLFSSGLLLLIKVLQTNAQLVLNDAKNLNIMLNNLEHLTINKAEHSIAYINGLFTLLELFGKRKHPIAPQIFRVCIQKYKLTINYENSINYGYNFLEVIEQFPSIPFSHIVDAIVDKFLNYKEVITDLDIQLLTRIAFGFNRNEEDQIYEKSPKIPDEKTALKIYNFLSKRFFEDVPNAILISDALVYIFESHANSQAVMEITVKLIKVGLAVHYANMRKLNMSKSIVEKVVKIDESNVLAKRKNMDVQYFLKKILSVRNQGLNNAVEPLICYSYIQSQNKNKQQAEGLARILSILGNVNDLKKKYQDEVKILHEEKKIIKKANSTPPRSEQVQLISVSTDLLKKRKIPQGQNYSIYLSRIEKITPDAKNGLLKALKNFQDKKKKNELQELRKLEEEQKKEEFQKKCTIKVLQKGIRIDPKIDTLHQYLYQFDSKSKELQKDASFDLSSLHVFNPNEQEDNDVQALKYLMKKYNKVLKVFYSNYGGKLRPNSITLFEQLAEKQNLMQVANVWKLFKDFELDEFMTIKQAQYLVQKINAIKKKSYYDPNLLDFEAFEDFIIQASLTMFTRPPKNLSGQTISQIVEETFYQFKMLAGQNKIDVRLFEDQSSNLQQDQNVASLNVQLQKNPDYILPEGYKKVVQKKVDYFHTISLDAFDSSYKDVLNILDDIFFEKLGFHIVEPFSEVTTNIYAKSLLSKKKDEKFDDFKEKYFSLNVKKQLFKYSGQDRQIARQVAFSISQIVDAVQNGRKSIVKNKYSYKQYEQEKKKAEEQIKKKRQRRDQELKKILQKHKQEKQQKKQKDSEEKLKQEKKAEEQKRKRQKYQQQLKKKVEEFQQKKQEQFKKQQQERKMEKKRQQELFEKKRSELLKATKQIQEKKQIEKKAAEQKQRKQKELLRSKSKKNINNRSPLPVIKKIDEIKTPLSEDQKQKQNKLQPSHQPQKKV